MKAIPAGRGHKFLSVIVLMSAITGNARANRFNSYTAKYKTPPDPVTIEIASYLGSSGSEWLAGGGFKADGTLVLGGTSWGPSLTIAGKKAEILGRDLQVPSPVELVVDKKGRTSLPDWRHANGTPFLVWITPDLKSVTRVLRLPWQAGPATAVRTGPDGNIYIAGMCGPCFDRAVQAEPVSTNSASTRGFLLKLDSGGSRVLWARTFPDAGKGLQLRIHNGRIIVEGGWVYTFSSDGVRGQIASMKTGGSRFRRAVNPADLSFCLGYDRNTRVGREPWRQPCLYLSPSPEEKAKGAQGKKLYQWDPHLVCSKKYRLVSDSSFQTMYYTDDGILWAAGWSDGGNTVLRRLPLDLDTGVPFAGLGFSAWGAGALSLSHLIKIDPATCKVLNQTLWCGYLGGRDKPNSVRVSSISTATDGSVLLSGHSAFGLIQTGNALHRNPDAPGGPYIAVLKDDLSSIRFSSTMVACGKVRIHDDGAGWRMVSDILNGHHKVLFLTSAIKEEGCYAEKAPAPTLNPIQEELAGGECDGYFVLMDLGPDRTSDGK